MKSHAQSVASPAPAFWRTAVLALAVVGALSGCNSTPGSARASAPDSSQQGASGITVYGTVDVGVSRSR